MLHTNITLMLVALLSLMLAGCADRGSPTNSDALAQARAAGALRVGVKIDSPPFGFELGGQATGFDVDVATAIGRQLGVETLTFVPVTTGNRQQALIDGRVDVVLASMTITRTRERDIDFSLPYFEDGQALMVAADSPIQSYLDLPDQAVGVVEGSTSERNLRQVAPAAKLMLFKDYQQLFAALATGKVAGISTDAMLLIGLAQKSGRPQAFRIAGDTFSTEPYGIGVAENQSNLRDAINEALQTLWESGQYQQIFDSWFGPGTPYDGKVRFSMSPYAP